MNNEATYNKNGVKVTFKKSLRTQIFYHHVLEVLTRDENAIDRTARAQYAFIAARVDSVKGVKWTPPAMGNSDDQIEASYQAFIDAVPDYEMFNEMFTTLDAIMSPLADPVQRTNEALTPEEQADPNS